MHTLVVGRGLRGELGEVTGESQVTRSRDLAGPFGQPACAARERCELRRQRGRGRGLEVRRVAVVPAAVEAPDVAHDELRLVVDRPEVRAREQRLRRAHRVHDVVEAGALVHQRERLLDQCLEQLGAFGQRPVHALAADDRQAVAR